MKTDAISFGVQVKESGEFRAVRHTGHTYDQDGNEVHGCILQESAWAPNLITSVGFNAELTTATINVSIVAGAGNTAPVSGNTTLQTYKGKHTTQIQTSRVVNLVPDVDGYVTITTIYRATFNPGTLGSGGQNISEAGTAMANLGAVTSATNLYSRGLLKDSFGAPLTISMNASTEYLDIYWKHTRYIPAEITGSQALTIMGSSIVHTYKIRPVFLEPTSMNNGVNKHNVWWALSTSSASPSTIPGLSPTMNASSYGTSSLQPGVFDGALSSNNIAPPAGNWLGTGGSSWTLAAYVTGSANRTISMNLLPAEGNLAAGIKSVTLKLNFQGWQVEIDPVIMKNATPARVLRLDFNVALANK